MGTDELKEIKIHSRGGQGGVTAVQILAVAAYKSGKEDVQAFPDFGAERRGAPVAAFLRISNEKIDRHSQIYFPDYIMVFDSYLLQTKELGKEIKNSCMLLLNDKRSPEHFNFDCVDVATLDALRISRELDLKVGGMCVVDAPMVGGMAKLLENEGLEMKAVEEAIEEVLGGKANANIQAARRGYDSVEVERG